MKILMLVDNLNVGGTETHILSISKDLLSRGHEIMVATQNGELSSLFEKNNIKIVFIEFNKLNLINLIRKHKIKIVHCHLGKSMDLCTKVHMLINVPYIITLHGLFYTSLELNFACSKASHIIAVSHPIKKMLLDSMNEDIEHKVSVIYNTFDLSKYQYENINLNNQIRKSLNIKDHEKIIVYCSRLSISKGRLAEQFIHSFYEVAKEFDNIHAIVIGDGPKKAHLDFYKKSLNSRLNKECVHILGSTQDVVSYYLESTFVVGSARVAIEAMSCKKPVIALGLKSFEGLVTPASSESMIDSYFGDHDIINSKNILELAPIMKYLLNMEKECIDLGNWSQNWCSTTFNNDRFTNLLAEIYLRYGSF